MMKLIFKSALLVVLFLALNLEAAVCSISYSSSMQLNDFDAYISQPFGIPKFDPASGELQSIELDISFEYSGDVRVSAPLTEEPVDIELGDVFAYFHPELYADFGLIPGNITQTIPISGQLASDSDQIIFEDFNWNDQYNIDLLDVSNALDEYTGTGNTPLGFRAGSSSIISSTPICISRNGIMDVDCVVTYNYTVPEPASLFLSAIGTLATIRRRK